MMTMDGMGTFGWGMGFGWIFMLIFWALIVIGLITVVQWIFSNKPESHISVEKSALQILEERYARGEIEREEFEQKKKDLSNSS